MYNLIRNIMLLPFIILHLSFKYGAGFIIELIPMIFRNGSVDEFKKDVKFFFTDFNRYMHEHHWQYNGD